MSTKAGQLLWNRRRLTLSFGSNIIDTGIRESNLAVAANSVDEPPLGVISAVPPAPGTTPASRVQVIPLLPIAPWSDITQGEPYVDEATGRVFVELTLLQDEGPVECNVLFWDPHSSMGPGAADTYAAPVIV